MTIWEVFGIILGIIGSIFLYMAYTINLVSPNGNGLNEIAIIIGSIFIWASGILLGAENYHR